MKVFLLSSLLIISSCTPIVPRDSDDYAAANQLVLNGTAKLEQGNYSEARADFILSNEINENALATDGLGCIAFLEGNLTEAERLFKKAYSLDNNYYNALGNLALLYDMKGMESQAIKLYKTSLNGEPKNYKIRNNFAALLYDNINREESNRYKAREELLKAKSVNADKIVLDNLERINKNERNSEEKR